MSRSTAIFLVFVLINLAGCSSLPTSIKNDVYGNIYSIFFENWMKYTNKPLSTIIVISDETSVHGLGDKDEVLSILKSLKRHMPGLDESTITSFQKNNASTTPLESKPNIRNTIVLISKKKLIDNIKKDENIWTIISKKYPNAGGILTLSKIGFSYDNSQALLYCSNYCGPLCGGGWFALLTKENDKWAFNSIVLAWIS